MAAVGSTSADASVKGGPLPPAAAPLIGPRGPPARMPRPSGALEAQHPRLGLPQLAPGALAVLTRAFKGGGAAPAGVILVAWPLGGLGVWPGVPWAA